MCMGPASMGFPVTHRQSVRLTSDTEAIGEPLAPWVFHDLRRTCNTGMGKLGVLPRVADECLGHVGAHKSGVQGVSAAARGARQSPAGGG
jgi:hypothetical protein